MWVWAAWFAGPEAAGAVVDVTRLKRRRRDRRRDEGRERGGGCPPHRCTPSLRALSCVRRGDASTSASGQLFHDDLTLASTVKPEILAALPMIVGCRM
jgi:hypothetical protein